jgi:hypothetical protein
MYETLPVRTMNSRNHLEGSLRNNKTEVEESSLHKRLSTIEQEKTTNELGTWEEHNSEPELLSERK